MEVQRTVTARSGLAAKIQEAGERKVRGAMVRVANDAADRANATFARDYQSRTGEGAGSITGRVEGKRFPIRIVLTSSVDHVRILNAGARPHQIRAVNKPLLVFPGTTTGLGKLPSKASRAAPRKGTAKRFRRSGADFSSGTLVRTPSVNHPGVLPGQFMERALRAALNAELRRR